MNMLITKSIVALFFMAALSGCFYGDAEDAKQFLTNAIRDISSSEESIEIYVKDESVKEWFIQNREKLEGELSIKLNDYELNETYTFSVNTYKNNYVFFVVYFSYDQRFWIRGAVSQRKTVPESN
jgi:hypothetical protein